jgi:hypothetical protein
MKKFSFLALVALLMIFGCSKEEIINTEQEPFSTEENNQPVVNGNKSGSVNSRYGMISFFSTSIKNNEFVNGCLPSPRKLLKQGTFIGNIQDFGKINSSLSRYTFSYCKEAPIDSPPNYGEPLMYKLIGDGKIYLSTRDYCSITITGNVYPWYYTDIQFDGGLFIGKATTSSGVGKLNNFNKTFEVYSNGRINLTTGEIPLNIRD